MTTYIVVLIVLALATVLAVWRARRSWESSPTRVWLSAPAVICGLVFVVVAWILVDHVRMERTLTAALQTFADNDDWRINCQSVDEFYVFESAHTGWVEMGDTAANLAYNTCQNLMEYVRDPAVRANPSDDHIFAISVITHEAGHLDGLESESITECYAVKEMHHMAVVLGATQEQARDQQRYYYEHLYPALPPAYISSHCIVDGMLGDHPDRSESP